MVRFSLSSPVKSSRVSVKQALWLMLGLAALSVVFFSELPLLHRGTMYDGYRTKLLQDRVLLFPHAVCGTLALLSGPLQFSTRLRQRHQRLHRLLGRLYVLSVFIAAPIAIVLSTGGGLILGTWVQATAWMICTLIALIMARNRHFVEHRQWMIRSYAVTFTFVVLRVLNPWPAYFNLPDGAFVSLIILVTFLAVALPDIAFNCRQISMRRT